MGLSSNTIIHFTNTFTALKGILSDDFKINYCSERVNGSSEFIHLGIPMVSFCDIPFSQIIEHVTKYGNYGVGLKKSWANTNKMNPVLYINKYSSIIEHLIHLIDLLKGGEEIVTIKKFTIEQKKSFDILRYIKNYQDDLKRANGKVYKDYRFSDEREWRYLMQIEERHMMFSNFKNAPTRQIKEWKQYLNSEIDHLRLKFSPDDINYIIIKSEKERDKTIGLIEQTKNKYSMAQVKRLTSRIVSVEQLKSDF